MTKILLQINVNKRDYNLLAKYGFMFEMNINDYLHYIAEQMRQEIAKEKKPKQPKAKT